MSKDDARTMIYGMTYDAWKALHQKEATPEQARAHHHMLMMQIVRMLCAGVVHGDLSAYNVLVDSTGPVMALMALCVLARPRSIALPTRRSASQLRTAPQG